MIYVVIMSFYSPVRILSSPDSLIAWCGFRFFDDLSSINLCSDSFTRIKNVQISCVCLPYALSHLNEGLRKIVGFVRFYNRYSIENSNLEPPDYEVQYKVLLKCMAVMPNPTARRHYH